MNNNTIETERLIIRPFSESDVDDYLEYALDPEVMKYIRPVGDPKQARELFLSHAGEWDGAEGKWMGAAVVLKESNKMIGDVGFRYKSKQHQQIEIGYKFNRHFQGHGYGSEALITLVKLIVRDWPFHKLVAYCEPRNIASWKLMEKIGMHREGYFQENFNFDGRWQNEVAYGVLKRNLKL